MKPTITIPQRIPVPVFLGAGKVNDNPPVEDKKKKKPEPKTPELSPNVERLTPDDLAQMEYRWPANVSVVSSSRQGQYTVAKQFVPFLIRHMQSEESLEAATAKINNQDTPGTVPRQGLPPRPQVSTDGPYGFAKKDNGRPRKVLIIIGYENKGEGLQADAEMLIETLVKEYGVARENITVLKEPNKEQIQTAMREMAKFAKDKKNAEAMVVMLGHGSSAFPEPGLKPDRAGAEGSKLGAIWLKDSDNNEDILFEHDMKTLTAHYLKDFRSVNLIVNSCSSGAWVADNRQPQPGSGRPVDRTPLDATA